MKWSLWALDGLAWFLAVMFASLLIFDFRLIRIPWESEVYLFLFVTVLQGIIGWLLYVYRGRYERGSFEEAASLAVTTTMVSITAWVFVLFHNSGHGIPRSEMLAAGPIALLIMFAARYAARMLREKDAKPQRSAEPVLIVGAGHIGTRLAKWMATDPASEYRPVGFLEDNSDKKHLEVAGVKVRGKIKDLAAVAHERGAKVIVIAVGNPKPELLRTIQDVATEQGLTIKVMPPIDDIIAKGVRTTDLRDLEIEDLLGRPPVNTHVEEVAGYLAGKRVLVTGAGGSIGQQLCMEINKYNPAELMMLDRDETGLQQAQINTTGTGLLDTPDVILADIRDPQTLQKIFHDRKPEVVFHAAALKHLPMLEQYPDEAWKTNVIGTLNVLEAARANGVTTFINISTDKAADPTSVLGHSKRVAEKLTAWMGTATGQSYISVRFGNVIGSRGSMLPTFTRLAREGKPLTVTHTDATRYFMTIPEACQLVLHSGGIGSAGEVLILDMGEPVRIMEIAQRIIAMSGKNIPIIVTGLREGEKLHEDLIGEGESDDRPYHPKISHAQVPPVAPVHLDKRRWDAVVETTTKPDPQTVLTPLAGIGTLASPQGASL